MSILLGILTVILIFVSIFLVFVVLMQKSKDGGMGAALGGGAAEAAFGADTSNVLSRSTIYAAILFFVLAFLLYLGRIYEHKHLGSSPGDALPTIAAPAVAPAPLPAGALPATVGPEATAPAVTLPTAPPTTTAPATPTPEPEAGKKN